MVNIAELSIKGDIQHNKNIKLPLKEVDIMLLQNAFLSPGRHNIQFSSLEESRCVISSIANSIEHYYSIAYISTKKFLKNGLDFYSFLNLNPKCAVELLSTSYFDCLYIENTKEMASILWYKELVNCLKMYNLEKSISIIFTTIQQ